MRLYSRSVTSIRFHLTPRLEDDRATLQALIDAMGGQTMTFLRDFDFGNAFDRERLEGLNVVVLDRRHAEHEFVDPELESLRRSLVEKGRLLLSRIAHYTFPLKKQ